MARTRVGDTNVYCVGCFTWIATKRKEVLKREGKKHLKAVPLIAIEKGCERCSTTHAIRLDSDRPTVGGGVLSVIVLAFVSIV